MKAFSPLPVLSALALALGASGAWAQSSTSGTQTAPVTPPAASSSTVPPAAGAQSSGSSSSADSYANDASGARYGRYGRGPGMMGGYGPGMMGGPGPGYGAGYGPGYGMGRDYGPGPGAGAGPDGGCGWGMGPGMMGAMGWNMGPGMMGGPGWGMGPGMMGGYGPGWGAGPGRALGSLDLDDAQRKQLRELQQQQRHKHWALMGQMHDEMEKLQDAWDGETGMRDRAAILAASKRLADLRQQGLESRLDAAEQFDKILTPEQREQLRSQWGGAAGRGRR